MTDSFWPDAKTSIILLPSGVQGESLLALAAEWTKMGLLGPALWVQPERFVAEVDFAKTGLSRPSSAETIESCSRERVM